MGHAELFTAQISPDQIPLLLSSKLKPALPYSLPLYRRCQFHLKIISEHPSSPPGIGQPEVWVAYIDKVAKGSRGLSSWLSKAQTNQLHDDNDPKEWLAVHINLNNPGETQVWSFGSWETTAPQRGITDPVQDDLRTSTRTALFRALFDHIRTRHIPAIPDEPPQPWLTLLRSGKLVSEPYRRSKVLFGAIAEPLWPYLQDDVVHGTAAGMTSNASPANTTCIARQDKPYLKYIIPVDGSQASQQLSSSPAGLHFAELSDAHLQLMLDRSSIPRSVSMLKTLVSVGLFSDRQTEPVAWGILSKEASVASLHTESDYRGRGLAEYVSKELIRRVPDAYRSSYVSATEEMTENDADESIPYAHADVSPSNQASRRVFEKLGGTVRWRNAWIEVDLERPSCAPSKEEF